MNTLPTSLTRFVHWWFVKMPLKLHIIVKRLLLFVNNEISFTLNLRLLFTPLFGDYTIIGRFIGIFLRIFFIVFGFVFVTFLLLLSLVLPLAWYAVLIAMVYYLDFWSIPIMLGLYLYVFYLNLNVPSNKITRTTKENRFSSFRPETLKFLHGIEQGNSYALHNFFSDQDIKFILKKSELLDKGLEEKLAKSQITKKEIIGDKAFESALKNKARYVEKEHLFLAILKTTQNIDVILSNFETSLDVIEKTVEWVVNQREYFSKLYFWQEDFSMPPISGIGHGLTGRVTPDLDLVSRDFTKLVKKGYLKETIGRDEEIEKISQYLGGNNRNILLIGEPGCGKTAIVMGIAHRVMHGTKYKTLQNKRIVSLEMGSLIAGAKSQGQIAERLEKAMNDVIGSGDIILFIDEIHDLVSSVNETEGFSTVFSILEPHLASDRVQFIAATNIENYRKYLEPAGSFSRLFEIIEIPESNYEDTIAILTHNATLQERKYGITITMAALLDIYKLSEKLIHDRVLPDKALDILNRTVSRVNSTTKFLNTKEVEKEVAEMTHIPITAVSESESKKLLNIDSEMQKRVIGQDHAIKKVASALKRARVGIRDEKKPIASFLFVGTTGVGKTETAKTLSATYFGDEKSMIRLDMSEYQTENSIDKLIGTSNGKAKGILTEEVKSKPFSVILLDEIEKAHHQIILAFLQVLDDGRLTDSTGRTADFTNSLIIATSNVGTKQIQQITERGGSYEEMEEAAMKAVREKFAPEFLNRFTAIIVYKSLDMESVKKIAYILLEKVKLRTKDKKIKVHFSEELVEELIKKGYDPQWGARPMARVIEDTVETYIAERIISKEFKPGDDIELGKEVFNTEE